MKSQTPFKNDGGLDVSWLNLKRSDDSKCSAMKRPTPSEVRHGRLRARLPASDAGKLVHVDTRTWQRWEDDGPSGRKMPIAAWELFLLKTGQKCMPIISGGERE